MPENRTAAGFQTSTGFLGGPNHCGGLISLYALSAEQITKPPPKPGVLKRTNINFLLGPMTVVPGLPTLRADIFASLSTNQVLDTESQPIHSIQDFPDNFLK